MQEYIKSQSFRGIIIGVAIAVVVLLIFQAGVYVGYRKASFAYQFGDSYYRAFDRHSSLPLGFPLHDAFRASHGAAGKVMGVSLPAFVVAGGPDGAEKTILVGSTTLIRKFDMEVEPGDIKTGDFVVAIGDPNENSQIQARLIRVLPNPPTGNENAH